MSVTTRLERLQKRKDTPTSGGPAGSSVRTGGSWSSRSSAAFFVGVVFTGGLGGDAADPQGADRRTADGRRRWVGPADRRRPRLASKLIRTNSRPHMVAVKTKGPARSTAGRHCRGPSQCAARSLERDDVRRRDRSPRASRGSSARRTAPPEPYFRIGRTTSRHTLPDASGQGDRGRLRRHRRCWRCSATSSASSRNISPTKPPSCAVNDIRRTCTTTSCTCR